MIRDLLLACDLPTRVRNRVLATFDALDAIVDIVGTCAALEVLGIDRVVCSPIALGRGSVHAAHGELPNPAPAVTGQLARVGAPAFGIDTRKEIATATGVALMTTLADAFEPLGAMRVRAGASERGAGRGRGRGHDISGARYRPANAITGREPQRCNRRGDRARTRCASRP